MPPAELADRAEVGRIARHDHHEVRPLHRRPGDPPRRVEAARIAVQKQRRHHPRVKRRLPQPAPVAAAHRGKVKLLSNQRHDQPRQMLLGHVVLHARRQKLRFIDLPGTKVLAHGYATNQTRPNLTSDFSDRLLATALFVARVARLAWKAGGRPSHDGVTESRTGLAPSIKEKRPWIIMPESTCHWNARACAWSMPTARSSARPRWQANRRR